MATTINFIEYVCDQIMGTGAIRYRKMFGEYMVYVNDKPILLVCDNNVYVKKLDCLTEKMQEAQVGFPYNGAKEHYILDIDNMDLSKEVVSLLESVTTLPIPKRCKIKK
jgi:TfoX/Sxy family transcriptional regulator of competence genes